MSQERKQTHIFAKGVILTLLFSIVIFFLVHTFLVYRYEIFSKPFESFAQTEDAKKLSTFGFNTQDSMNTFQESFAQLKEQLKEESELPSTKVQQDTLDQLEEQIQIQTEQEIQLYPFDISIILPIGYTPKYVKDKWIIEHELEEYQLTVSQESTKREIQGEEIMIAGEKGYIVSQTFGTFDQKHEMNVILPKEEYNYLFSAIMYNGSKELFIEMTKDLIQKVAYAKEKTRS